MKSAVMTGVAVVLSFMQEIAAATCTDCDYSEESVLLQQMGSLNQEHALGAGEGHGDETCQKEVEETQAAWRQAILDITASYLDDPEGDYVEVAKHAIYDLYAYGVRKAKVLFKPTKAAHEPFRSTEIGALSYFVGYEATKDMGGIPEDGGFAINGGEGWKKVLMFNDRVSCSGDLAFAQGYYYFTNAKTGAVAEVEYSFVYQYLKRKWRIVVHHSSVPFPVQAPKESMSLMQISQNARLSKEWLQNHMGSSKHNAVCSEEVEATQAAWRQAILDITASYLDDPEGDYVEVAKHAIHDLYGYDIKNAEVMFKPTKAAHEPFRPTKIGALSYFVGYEATKDMGGFSEDGGFAINGGEGWKKVLMFNDLVSCLGDYALAQGYYYFTNAKTGAEVGVEYTFGYQKFKGSWKIILHHSSVPFPVEAPVVESHLLQMKD